MNERNKGNSGEMIRKITSADYIADFVRIYNSTKDDIERLFRSHYAAMYRLAMLILRDEDVARDIVYDVFEALLVSWKVRCIP